jgi:hypothetical protein
MQHMVAFKYFHESSMPKFANSVHFTVVKKTNVSSNEVIARSCDSQPYVNYTNLLWECYYKSVIHFFCAGGKMMWVQLGLSVIPEGQYNGLSVLDLSGLVDKTTQITFEDQ